MLNRRSSLVNLVTLQITSNVSSTIVINGESFTGTSASKRIRQGSEVSWSVSADGYITKSGTEVMSGNKELSVSLVPSTVTFTISTNVNASITINGDTSSGVTSKSLVVSSNSNVSWSVSADKYTTQSGTESIKVSDISKDVTLVYNGTTSICTTGYIWCTDGSFVEPSMFQSSGKEGYGYAIDNNTVASLKKSDNKYWWSSDYTLIGATSLTDGVYNSNMIRSYSKYSSSTHPSAYECLNHTNAGITSYMPSKNEVWNLYDSIMSGNMKTDLTTAGLYESCNYRIGSYSGTNSWCDVTTSTEIDYWRVYWKSLTYPSNADQAKGSSPDYGTLYAYVIPFFHFD